MDLLSSVVGPARDPSLIVVRRHQEKQKNGVN